MVEPSQLLEHLCMVGVALKDACVGDLGGIVLLMLVSRSL